MDTVDYVKRFRRKCPTNPAQTNFSSLIKAPNASGLRGSPALEGMKEWLLLLGHTPTIIDNLNVIHVAGTKGKGSTCAFVDSFLREHGRNNGTTRKIGLYTSPSLWPQNRIRIDSNPLSEEQFIQRFEEVCAGLSFDPDELFPANIKTPGLLQMMAIVSFHTFVKEGVDVVICETHHGGQFDATNFVDRPVITAITKIGIDHVDSLGGSIGHIAWHKSGIFKDGVIALSVPQVPEAEEEIKRRGKELGASLHFVENVKSTLLQFVTDAIFDTIQPEQQENCALAAQIAHTFLQMNGQSLQEQDVQAGILKFRWPARFDIVEFSGCTWYLDGAHNEMSMQVVGKWYERVANTRSTRVLIFAHFSPERRREWFKILRNLGETLKKPVQHVVFVKQIEFDDHISCTEERQQAYAQFWKENWPHSMIYKVDCVKDSIEQAMNIDPGAQILVTGSLYLVEAALKILSSESEPGRCEVCTHQT